MTRETQPLLRGSSGGNLTNDDDEIIDGAYTPKHPAVINGAQTQIYLLLVMVAGLDFTVFMLNLPLTRVYESIICYHYWAAVDPGRFPDEVPEALCKGAPVQEELAIVKGYEMLFMSLPGMLLALPYGYLADRIGRKPVLMLSALGLAASLSCILLICHFPQLVPLRMVWAAWLLTVCGGGASVVISLTFSMLTDLTTERERATVFLRLAVAILIGQAVAAPLASAMMEKLGTTLPILVAYSIGLASCFLTVFTTETSEMRSKTEDDDTEEGIVMDAEITGWIAKLTDKLTLVLKSLSIVALISSFFVNAVGTSANNIIVQYASKRFDLSISQAGNFLTIRAVATIFAFLVLIPLGSRLLGRWFGIQGSVRDLWVTRATVLFIPVGFFLIAAGQSQGMVAGGMVLTAMGSGYSNLMRSVATGIVHPSRIAQLHGVITTVETSAQLVSGPCLAKAFSTGLRDGCIGLPFYLGAILTALGSTLVWVIRIPEAVNHGDE
ncbi:major facilitator superfamily domain-containing protein [Stachybotrys elegans]|uniref:Major facilitator superfamily domain-containing protein n=1 Tax=Stachybotrys elegans TaxID=80388 RepID=A0A8K0SB06_9HYPO|nr:major facilitator superfamily domain-containing protein [Stachybotrys elegans]